MTIDQVKESLSNSFVSILATNRRFVLEKPTMDVGVDFQLKKFSQYTRPDGKFRVTPDPRHIDIQLKATTVNGIVDEPTQIKYDLKIKNYNDLVDRKNRGIAPLILILLVLPQDELNWVKIDLTEISLRKHAYWYQPDAGLPLSANVSTKTIAIPKVNILGIDIFPTLHGKFYP